MFSAIITTLVLLINRQNGCPYQQIMNKATYSFDNMSPGDKIIGYYNAYDIYQDYYIENYESLIAYSDDVVLVRVDRCEQLGNAVYATVIVEKTLQGSIPENKVIKVIMPNYISYNSYNKNNYSIDITKDIHIKLISPCVNMKEDEEYVVFLNEMVGYHSTYRLSTLLYSIVPFKESINVLLVDYNEINKFMNKLKCSADFDYIAVKNQPINRQSILDENYLNRVEKAELLASDYTSRYADICNSVYEAINKKCRIDIVSLDSVNH